MERVPHQERYPRSLWLAVAGALFGAFQFGYQVGVLNTALPFISKDLHYHKDGILSSAIVLGAAAGAITAGKLADVLGPRHAQVANCLAFVVGSLVAGLARHHVSFLAGRFIAGIGAGAASLYVPRYIAEVSPPALRGWLGSLNQVFINIGILVAYCSGIPYEMGFTGFDVLGGVWCSWWRIMIGTGLLPAAMQVFVLAWCPESPVWLEGIGRQDAADTACLKLWGVHALVPDPDYEADLTNPAHLSAAAGAAGGVCASSQQPLLAGSTGTGSSSVGSGMLGLGSTSSPVRRLHQPHQLLTVTAAGATWDSPRYAAAGTAATAAAAGSGGWDGSSSYVGMSGLRSASSDLGWGDTPRYGWGSNEGAGQGRGFRTGGWDSLWERQYRWMMLLALGLPLLQQASGINTVVFYSSQVFATAGLKSPIAASIITGGVNLLFTIAAAAVMDRYGRKPLLLLSHTGMTFSLGAVAGLSVTPLSNVVKGWVMVGLVLVYVAFFALGSGPVTWVLLAEVLPPSIKGPAASLATAAGWAGNLVVTGSFDSLLKHLGLGGTYMLYAFANAAGIAYVVGLVVETKCRSLAEIEQLLLLPDRDPRLAALLPALQRSSSNVSSNGLPLPGVNSAATVSPGLNGGGPQRAAAVAAVPEEPAVNGAHQ